MLALSVWRLVGAFTVAIFIAVRGYRKRSLSRSGALCACAVGAVHFFVGFSSGFLLLAFFYSSSALTKYKSKEKLKLEAGHKEGS